MQPDSCLLVAAAAEPSGCPEGDSFPSRFVPAGSHCPAHSLAAAGSRWSEVGWESPPAEQQEHLSLANTHTAQGQALLAFPMPHCSFSPCCRHLGCPKAAGFNTNPAAQMGNIIYHGVCGWGFFGDGPHCCSQSVMYSLSFSKHVFWSRDIFVLCRREPLCGILASGQELSLY